jgi:hypothetical protein
MRGRSRDDSARCSFLKLWFGDFDGRLPGGCSGELDLAFVDAVSGGDVKGVFVKVAVVDATVFETWFGKNQLHPPGLIKDLESGFGTNEKVSGGCRALAVEGAALVGGGSMGVEKGLFIDWICSLQPEGMDEGAIKVADIKLGLVRAEPDSVDPIEWDGRNS